jgi:hypothetical protein
MKTEIYDAYSYLINNIIVEYQQKFNNKLDLKVISDFVKSSINKILYYYKQFGKKNNVKEDTMRIYIYSFKQIMKIVYKDKVNSLKDQKNNDNINKLLKHLLSNDVVMW